MQKSRLFTLFLLFFSLCVSAQQVVYLTTADFKAKVFDYTTDSVWHYKGKTPCVIDFYATWCGPCKRLSPVMEELAQEYGKQVVFYKVDVDKERELAYYFRTNSVPTLLFIPKSGKPEMAQGALPKETLVKVIDKVLLNKE